MYAQRETCRGGGERKSDKSMACEVEMIVNNINERGNVVVEYKMG
jgi:hypothetical protein